MLEPTNLNKFLDPRAGGYPYRLPLWVRIVYNLAERWERFFSRVSSMTQWRYTFQDAHCHCENCVRRRNRGMQAPAFTWSGWAKKKFSFWG